MTKQILFLYFLIFCFTQAHANDFTLSKSLHDDFAHIFMRDAPYPSSAPQNILTLGETIFFDKKLSKNKNMSCASCHKPELAFTDGLKTAKGNKGQPLLRKTMTLYNIGDDPFFFWDGSAKTLEEQFFKAISHPDEMALSKIELLKYVQNNQTYQKLFKAAQKEIHLDNIAYVTARYIENLRAPYTRFDAWIEGDYGALSHEELLGFALFNNKANCTACHIGPDFTDNLRNDIGLDDNDLGYGAITNNPDDYHFFKTTGLRAIKNRAPYMHHGAFTTLEDVIDHYNDGNFKRGDTDIPAEEDQGDIIAFHNFTQPLNLTEQEKSYLVAFLKTL